MAAPKKREVEHRFLARIDNTPKRRKPGNWDRISDRAAKDNVSANDVLNNVIEVGLRELGI